MSVTPPQPHPRGRWFLVAAIFLWLAALASHFWVAPWAARLPADYRNVIVFASTSKNRVDHTEEWVENVLNARQADETLDVTGNTSKIQSSNHWTTQKGELFYETQGLYGVNRSTMANVAEFGDKQRKGQYLFPPGTEKISYDLWDSFYSGPRTATYSHMERLGSLEVYVFNCHVENLDDTEGYLYLDDVPERYRAISEGTGKVLIEPVSGVMVDFFDQGQSYFIDAKTREKYQVFALWVSRYDDATKASQLRLARWNRTKILATRWYIPAGMGVAGLALLLAGLLRKLRPSPKPEPAL